MTCGCLLGEFETPLEGLDIEDMEFSNLDGTNEAYDYQKKGVEFFYKTPSSGQVRKKKRILLGDDTGLGKTVQALLALKNDKEGTLPALICVRPPTFDQWFAMIKKWFREDMLSCQPLQGSGMIMLPGFDIYLISMDSLRLLVEFPTDDNGLAEPVVKTSFLRSCRALPGGGFKTVIFDECHSIKSDSSSRTRALLTILGACGPVALSETGLETGEPQGESAVLALTGSASLYRDHASSPGDAPVLHTREHSYYDKDSYKTKVVTVTTLPVKNEIPNILMMSATAIKNRAGEYFTALNILAPEIFYSKSRFEYEWLDFGGKFLKTYRVEEFRNLTSDFILRRTKEEVLPDLPELRRDFTWISITDDRIKKIYNDEVKKIQQKIAEGGQARDFQENLMTMRRIIGIAKAMFACDVISSDPESLPDKYVIGIHHYDASSVLYESLKPLNPLIYDGQTRDKNAVIQEFIKRDKALLILSMSAGGVGVDGLQCCNEVLGCERMWSAADESQFEGRFVRIGSTHGRNHVRAEYYVVKKTIDEYFHFLVEEKRKIFGQVIDGEDPLMDTGNLRKAAEFAAENKL